MSLILDSSVLVAALSDRGQVGEWAEALILKEDLFAPHIMLAEATNILRRLEARSILGRLEATSAHRDALSLGIEFLDFAPLADRIWELRANLTAYDAWYVAAAESLGLPLATLDQRLARATGPRCKFHLPPHS
ncbi:MAG: type II toxin-antitoxin system VapC family toxin [Deltaproteobacteria bacterium]